MQELTGNAAQGGATFDILQPDSFFVPFGEYPHKAGLQIFDQRAAEQIVSNHNGTLAKIARRVTGTSYPVYIGHPDLPGGKDTDKRAYGWIENMAIETGGLRLAVKWSDAGAELVSNAHFKFYSPLWWTIKTPAGIRPTALKSMGLTNDPNIPVPALANEADPNTENQPAPEEPMNPQILEALGLAPDATQDDVLTAIQQRLNAVNPEPDPEANPEPDPEAKPEPEPEVKPEPEPELVEDEATKALKDRLCATANELVNAAVLTGRLTPADAQSKLDEILSANDIVSALTELRESPVIMKVASSTGDLGNAKTRLVLAANDESKAARDARQVAVANEYQATNPALPTGERTRIAWERAQRKAPELFTKSNPQ